MAREIKRRIRARAAADRFGRRGAQQVPGQAGLRPGEAGRTGRLPARRRRRDGCGRCRCDGCGASDRATARRLEEGGIVQRRASCSRPASSRCEALVGPRRRAPTCCALARGEDDRPVNPEHQAKSISEERTYGEDLTDPDEIDRALLARAEGVARQLRREGARREGRCTSRCAPATSPPGPARSTLPAPTDLTEPIVDAARRLYRERIRLGGKGVRLLGVGVSGLEPGGPRPGLAVRGCRPSPARAGWPGPPTPCATSWARTPVTRARLLRGKKDERRRRRACPRSLSE